MIVTPESIQYGTESAQLISSGKDMLNGACFPTADLMNFICHTSIFSSTYKELLTLARTRLLQRIPRLGLT